MFRHCAMKRGPGPLADDAASPKIDSGTVVSATSASSGEIVNIITATPTSSSTDVSIWLSVCWRLWATLSRSLVTRLSRSPRGWLVDVAERQRVELVLGRRPAAGTSAAARRRRACTAMTHAEHRRRGVERDRLEQDAVQLAEVDAAAAGDAVDDDVGGPAEDPRARAR